MSISLSAAADGLSATLQLGSTDIVTLDANKLAAASGKSIEATSGPDGSAFSFRNKIINGGFAINQRGYVSAAAVGSGLYGHDRWKMAASGDTYTFSTTNNKTTVTIPAGKVLRQVVEGLNLQTGTYVLSWEGTAQGKIGAGSLSASGVTGSITGGTNTTIEFGPGTVANIQLEPGTVATPFESRPVGVELALCQRYGKKLTGYGIGFTKDVADLYNGTCQFGTPMRTSPTLDAGATYAANTGNAGTVAALDVSIDSIRFYNSSSNWTANAKITVTGFLSAEL